MFTRCHNNPAFKSHKRKGDVMLVEKEVKRLYHELIQHEYAQVFLSGSDITVRAFDNHSKIFLTTPIYFGGNYIPKSVRQAIAKTPPFDKDQTIKTSITVDEENFRIFLNFIGAIEILNNKRFHQLLEDFCYLAEEWRIYLDEHDRNDLVYVRAG